MPDSDRRDVDPHGARREPPPSSWTEAFAALPDAAPPADGWARVAAALDARGVHTATAPGRRGRAWPRWTAAAAVLALAAVPAWQMREQRVPAVDDVPPARVAIAPSRGSSASAAAATSPPPTDATATTPGIVVAPPPPRRASQARDAEASAATTASPPQVPRVADVAAIRADGADATGPSLPDTGAAAAVAARVDDDAGALASLQRESGVLESLVLLARDDRVASATAAAMSAEFDERIAVIDAALAQTGLDDAQRTSLWQQRVALLRDLAGVEGTQRWFASSGEAYDGALVSVD